MDELFIGLVTKHAEHPDVKQLPTGDLVEALRQSRMELLAAQKDMTKWVPPVKPREEVAKFQPVLGKFVNACGKVRSYINQFATLKCPNQVEKESLKRHWRAERTKITEALVEHRKIPGSIAKVAADVLYDGISACVQFDINFGYVVPLVLDGETVQFDAPVFFPKATNSEDRTPLQTACATTLDKVRESPQYKECVDGIVTQMKAGRIYYGRRSCELTNQFPWPEDLLTPSTGPLKVCVNVFTYEIWDISYRAIPFRLLAGLWQVVDGDFTIILLPFSVANEHSNLAQWIHSGDQTLFSKCMCFKASPGESIYVPFGWVFAAFPVSKAFVDVYLGNDAKLKAAMQKKPKPAEKVGVMLFHPLFDAHRDVQQSVEQKNAAAYTWAQAAHFIPQSWRSDSAVQEYWTQLALEASACANDSSKTPQSV